MSKKKNQILVSLSLVPFLGGCSDDEIQRDVYNSRNDCLADWKRSELCEEEQSYESSSSSGSSSYHSSGKTISSIYDDSLSSTHSNGQTNSHISGSHIAGGAAAGAGAGYMMTRYSGNVLGPAYHPSNRAVYAKGAQIIRPQENHSIGKPILVKGKAGSTYSRPVSRGGFSSGYSARSSGG